MYSIHRNTTTVTVVGNNMEKIFSDFVNSIKDCSTTIKSRIYNNVYNKDMLYGIFADGNGNGYIERESTLPKYARNYIHKFIKNWTKK